MQNPVDMTGEGRGSGTVAITDKDGALSFGAPRHLSKHYFLVDPPVRREVSSKKLHLRRGW
jgi:hypothetical protein